MIGVLNYGAGNLGSVMNALARLGLPAQFVSGPEELQIRRGVGSHGKTRSPLAGPPYTAIIFPGDGHFTTAMGALEQSGYAKAIQEWITADLPFLGICIGLQLLFESSEEAPPVQGREVRGLSIIPGRVRKFQGPKVPQIGWNETRGKARSRLFRDLPERSFFYYIHSYYVVPDHTDWTAAEADYYGTYCSAVERGALTAVQFHPEKSGALGLALLRRWAEVYHVS